MIKGMGASAGEIVMAYKKLWKKQDNQICSKQQVFQGNKTGIYVF